MILVHRQTVVKRYLLLRDFVQNCSKSKAFFSVPAAERFLQGDLCSSVFSGRRIWMTCPRFPRLSIGFPWKIKVDSPRVTDIEQERVGGRPLDPVSRLEEELRGGIPVFRDPYPGQFLGLYDEVERFPGYSGSGATGGAAVETAGAGVVLVIAGVAGTAGGGSGRGLVCAVDGVSADGAGMVCACGVDSPVIDR